MSHSINRQPGHTATPTMEATRRYCECGRELSVLAREFGPNLTGHLVRCEACGGYGHHSENHTVCMRCGRYQYEEKLHL